MKIVATSDLHGQLNLRVPECDVLVVAGDVCPDYGSPRVGFVGGVSLQLDFLDGRFRQWLKDQPAKHILGIAGNHDFVFERMKTAVRDLELPWTYLQDSGVTIDGVKFYGLPWVPNLSRWAFHLDDYGLDSAYNGVPDDTDVVISHGPPQFCCDMTVPRYGAVNAGAPHANGMLKRVQPAYYFCGHIHEGYGHATHRSGAEVYNVSRVDIDYRAVNAPVEVSLAHIVLPS